MATASAEPILLNGTVSIARLHGRACWHCGAVARRLRPVGRVRRSGSAKVWTIYTCGCAVGPTS
jgi:hypothetical protein